MRISFDCDSGGGTLRPLKGDWQVAKHFDKGKLFFMDVWGEAENLDWWASMGYDARKWRLREASTGLVTQALIAAGGEDLSFDDVETAKAWLRMFAATHSFE